MNIAVQVSLPLDSRANHLVRDSLVKATALRMAAEVLADLAHSPGDLDSDACLTASERLAVQHQLRCLSRRLQMNAEQWDEHH